MKKRGYVVTIIGLISIGISLNSVATSIVPSTLTGSNDLSISTMFEGMFNENN